MIKVADKKPMSLVNYKKEMIMEQLRNQGLRITAQRQLLINIILEDECSSCKEIYYEAVKYDSSVGIATVYRLVKVLEDLKLIDRKNLYVIDYKNLDVKTDQEILFIDEKTEKVTEVKKGKWYELLQTALMEQGLLETGNISIVIKKNNKKVENSGKDEVCKTCKCTNTNCKYHCKPTN